ncbi:uncharacterized protein KIAA0040 homolog [Clinocottus analis]|uniref:uncharacterized protein KIAA0040 homolog n=1 Tax=Clinocottus analis TaxID=304258 RepID=UPI0035C16F8E
MDAAAESIRGFFLQLWRFAADKHSQGAFNTACLAVLCALPLLVVLAALVVCCHCCCCRHANSCCCCKGAMATTRSETKKRKNSAEDLWISVKTGPRTPDRVALAME